jgi:protein SCO1/2
MNRTLLAALAALLLAACGKPEPAAFHGVDITGSDWGRDFALTDHQGKPRRLADFRGKVVVLSFGYTRCPDICPTTLAAFAEAMKLLGPESDRIQVLFVTIDPERDTPGLLAEFVPWFDARFVGLRGDAAATAVVAKEFNVFYEKRDTGSAAGYAMDHTAGSYVFDAQGRLRLFVRHGDIPQAIVDDLRLLLAGK